MNVRPMIDDRLEGRLFRQLWLRQLMRTLQQHLTHGILRTATVVVLTIVFWSGMYWLFYEGFQFLRNTVSDEPTRASLVQSVYNTFFFSLMGMLAASAGILFYTAVYGSPDTAMLLTSPARPSRIALDKFLESAAAAGWAFAVLGTPLLLAYGVVSGAPWYYYVLMPLFLASFITVAAGFGALACLVMVAKLYRYRRWIVALILALFACGGVALVWGAFVAATQDATSPRWFHRIQQRLQVTQVPWLPSWWLSAGLLEAAHPSQPSGHRHTASWREAMGYLSVLASTAALMPLLIGGAGDRWLRDSFGQLRGHRHRPRSEQTAPIDRFLERLLRPVSPPLRLLLIKDIRLFRRDPIHWSQLLILVGLLGLYFLIVPRLRYGSTGIVWLNCIGFFNLTVVGLLSSTLTTRFIYPLISLEGQRFWILGTLPVRRDEILWSKLVFSVCLLALPCSTLVLLSDFTLQIPQETPWMTGLHLAVTLAMCLGLAGLAVGLGARLPDLRETSPAKISANFGGTLNLVLSALYILLTVAAVGIPSCCWLHTHRDPMAHPAVARWGNPGWIATGIATAALLTVLVTLLPLRAGFRHFRQLEV